MVGVRRERTSRASENRFPRSLPRFGGVARARSAPPILPNVLAVRAGKDGSSRDVRTLPSEDRHRLLRRDRVSASARLRGKERHTAREPPVPRGPSFVASFLSRGFVDFPGRGARLGSEKVHRPDVLEDSPRNSRVSPASVRAPTPDVDFVESWKETERRALDISPGLLDHFTVTSFPDSWDRSRRAGASDGPTIRTRKEKRHPSKASRVGSPEDRRDEVRVELLVEDLAMPLVSAHPRDYRPTRHRPTDRSRFHLFLDPFARSVLTMAIRLRANRLDRAIASRKNKDGVRPFDRCRRIAMRVSLAAPHGNGQMRTAWRSGRMSPFSRINMNRVFFSVVFALALLGQGFASPFRFSPQMKRDRLMAFRMLPRIMQNVERDLSQDLLDLLMQLQEMMQNGDPENGIPVLDPFLWEHFETTFDTEQVELAFSIDGLDMRGLSNFEVTNVEFDILSLRVDVAANWPQLDIKADHYFLDGTLLGLLPLFGEGYIDMSILEFAIDGGASLVALPGEKNTYRNHSISVGELSFSMTFGELQGVIDGLLGGGELSDVLNEILNMMGAELFNSVLQMAADDIAVLVQGFLNQMLEGMTLQDLLGLMPLKEIAWEEDVKEFFAVAKQRELERSNANDYVDALLENAQEFIIENGFDNFALPDLIEQFSEEFLWIEWHGEASLTQGFLRGLETIHRTGDATLDTSGNTITIAANIGFNVMEAGYRMHVDFMDIGIDLDAAVTIQDVTAYFKRSRLPRLPARSREKATLIIGETLEITIDELDVTNQGIINVDFSGLGFLDFLLEALSWIVVNLFGGLIIDAIEGPIKDALENALSEILPFKYIV
ncbi:unnamed protein product [Darwinula stevensoni]|uniref:Uncharacterized protein n=1 Tax=Darwinula stevensoni TaxID=69355 RepID=A0A7R9A6T6_9CRUS|nr:unnamed protein product [Darwinula stevensoni]CAG0888919.1 unnamed protein product [Darwinula stevensoni]